MSYPSVYCLTTILPESQVASPKGLFCGSGIAFKFHSHHQISLLPKEASLIPVGREISDIMVSKNKFGWVLVVEKEVVPSARRSTHIIDGAPQAIFQTLCSNGLANSPLLSRHGLIITVRKSICVNAPDRSIRAPK
jgi:meiotic recombination protein SPO11